MHGCSRGPLNEKQRFEYIIVCNSVSQLAGRAAVLIGSQLSVQIYREDVRHLGRFNFCRINLGRDVMIRRMCGAMGLRQWRTSDVGPILISLSGGNLGLISLGVSARCFGKRYRPRPSHQRSLHYQSGLLSAATTSWRWPAGRWNWGRGSGSQTAD